MSSCLITMGAAVMARRFSWALVRSHGRPACWAFTSDCDDRRRVRCDDLVGRVQHSAHVACGYDRGTGGVGENVVAGMDGYPADHHRMVRLVGGDGVAAPPRCFATAVDGQVVVLEFGEVAQPPVGEYAGE